MTGVPSGLSSGADSHTQPGHSHVTTDRSSNQAALILAVLLALSGLLFFIGLGDMGLTDRDEGRNAEAGREMFAADGRLTLVNSAFSQLLQVVTNAELAGALDRDDIVVLDRRFDLREEPAPIDLAQRLAFGERLLRLREADAGIVYQTDVTGRATDDLDTLDIPVDANVTASYPIAQVADARNPEAGAAFIEFDLRAIFDRAATEGIPAGDRP
mgnify:CR=1 FL=1